MGELFRPHSKWFTIYFSQSHGMGHFKLSWGSLLKIHYINYIKMSLWALFLTTNKHTVYRDTCIHTHTLTCRLYMHTHTFIQRYSPSGDLALLIQSLLSLGFDSLSHVHFSRAFLTCICHLYFWYQSSSLHGFFVHIKLTNCAGKLLHWNAHENLASSWINKENYNKRMCINVTSSIKVAR